jgi:hypothetical protein
MIYMYIWSKNEVPKLSLMKALARINESVREGFAGGCGVLDLTHLQIVYWSMLG